MERKTNSSEEKNGSEDGNETENNMVILKLKEKVRFREEESESCSHIDKLPI